MLPCSRSDLHEADEQIQELRKVAETPLESASDENVAVQLAQNFSALFDDGSSSQDE